MNRLQRQREENRRLVAGEGTLRQIQKNMRAEARSRGEHVPHVTPGLAALAVVVVIAGAGAFLAVELVNGVATLGAQGAKVRLVDHQCGRAGNGSELVNAQLANDGKTGKVEASAYALLFGGKIVNVMGWQYAKSIAAGSADFFQAEVPISPGAQVIGCGVLLGAGAPKGITYLPPVR
jgi:hypothetical protein